jgi:hypothetical protein
MIPLQAPLMTEDYFRRLKYIFDMSKQLSELADNIGEHDLAIILGSANDFRRIIKEIREYK